MAVGGVASLQTRLRHCCRGPGLYLPDEVPKLAPIVSLLCCWGLGVGVVGRSCFLLKEAEWLEPVSEKLGTVAEAGGW